MNLYAQASKLRAICLLLMAIVGGCTTAHLRTAELPQAARDNPQRYVVVAVHNDTAAIEARVGGTIRGYDAVVHYGASPRSRRLIVALGRDYGLETVAGWPIDALHYECVVYRINDGPLNDELLSKLAHDPRVRLAQPLNVFNALAAYDDPYAGLQKDVAALGLESAHRVARGAGVRIAIVDTGVSLEHPDLEGRVAEWHDFVGGGAAAFRRDLHGTEVAGVIAARANNHIGIVGVAPDSELLALKACWQPALDAHAVCNTFTLAQAISSAVERRARIVNLSLTGPSDALLAQVVRWAMSRGVIFVGAVAADGRLDAFPAEVPGVLAVDRAESAVHAANVLYAPGDGILTLTPPDHYDFASGSSMAAAEVSGVVALLLEHRTLDAETVRALLIGSAQTSGLPTMINACRALAGLDPGCAALPTGSGGTRFAESPGAAPR